MPTSNDDVIWPDQKESGVKAEKKSDKPPADKAASAEALRTLLFAAVTCAIVSAMLATAFVALKPRADANELAFRQQNVISAFGYRVDKKASAEEAPTHFVGAMLRKDVDATFAMHVKTMVIDAETGEIIEGAKPGDKELKKRFKEKTALPIYAWFDDLTLADDHPAEAYVIPVNGYGLWGTVYGYLGVEADLETIRAITFYKHKETAGLGGECEKEWFTKQFVGKKIRAVDGGIADFKVVKAKKEKDLLDNPYAVGGISASTITGDGIQKFLVEDAKRFEPYFQKILAANAAP